MTIRIMGRDINIVVVPDTDLLKMADEEEGCLGFFKDDKIFIASSLQGAVKRRVIIHEVSHAIFTISGLTNLLEDNLEEALADAMESLDESNLFLLLSKL